MGNCVFCKIIAAEIPSKKEYEDDICMAFHDIHPKSQTHLLIIPKKHIPTLKDLVPEDENIMGRLMKVASELGQKFNLGNYKIIINVGVEAGQEVFHLHLHLRSVE